MTSIKIITKFREVFSRFEENKNVINISSVKNWFNLKNQELCLLNNIKKLKQSEVDQEFYMDFVKYIKPLLMFVHHLDLYLLQLELLVTNLLSF